MRDSARKSISPETLIAGTEQEGVLWSASTGRQMIVAITEDARAGFLSSTEAELLIGRVWARATRT